MKAWLSALAVVTLAACGSDRGLPDTGVRPDAGFFVPNDVGPLDTGTASLPDAQPADADGMDAIATDMDAQTADATPTDGPAFDDAQPMDAGPNNPDALSVDAQPADAAPDAQAPDAQAPDAQAPDAQPMDATPLDAGAPDGGLVGDAGVITQSGGLVISEFLARGAVEWFEVSNTTAQSVNLTNYTVSTLSRAGLGPLVVRATSDPTGAAGTAVMIAPGASMVGVANPTTGSAVPAIGRFVIGTPGQLGADWLANGGDVLTLRSPANAGDAVDFRAAATNLANPIGATEYPLLDDVPTQLDLPVVGGGGELGNDNGAVWCAPLFRGGTPNAANRDCTAFVISELTYDYASPGGGGDDGQEFVELAGAAGGSMAGVFVAFIDGSSHNTNGAPIAVSGARMPLDGVYVIADIAPGMTGSFVANVDQLESIGVGNSSAIQNGPDAVQLYRQTAGAPVYLDAFGYGTLSGASDTVRMLPFFEGSSVPDITGSNYPVNWARADDEADTGNNLADFAYVPTPTPGLRNGSPAMVISAITPPDAIAGTSVQVTLSGTNFSDSMTASFAQTPAPTVSNQAVTVVNAFPLQLSYPAGGSGAAERVNVTLSGRSEFGRSVTVTGGFTWTVANNETGAANECDFCNLQFPAALLVAAGAASSPVFGRIFEGGRTDTTTGGPAPNIVAELGYGPSGSDPRAVNWTWTRATFNVESGNDDEYRATLTAPTVAGTYAYTYRFSLDGGLSWSYADRDGAGSNAGLIFTVAQLGALTVP